jgi:hypothetical protein
MGDSPLEPVLVRPEGSGRFAHYRIDEVADCELNGDELYIASGLFYAGRITRWSGRRAENVGQVLWLPFDFDLSDWLGLEKSEVYRLSNEALGPCIAGLRAAVEGVFVSLGLPVHLLIHTGHGLCACVRLASHPPEAIPELRRLHKTLVERINAVAGYRLADPQVSDAGTRIVRLPGTVNLKGVEPRPVVLLAQRDGWVTIADLRAVVQAALPQATHPAPGRGSVDGSAGESPSMPIAPEDVTAMVEVLRPFWHEGSRHLLALGIAGLLAKAGIGEATATSIVDALAADDPERADRLRAVQTTYERMRVGGATAGYTALARLLPVEIHQWLDARLAPIRAATSPRLVIGQRVALADDEPEQVPEFEELPDACLSGWIRAYVAVMQPTTEAPRAYHYGVGMTIAGAITGRRIGIAYGADPLFPNLYTLLIGRSGRSRKDTAIKRGMRFMTGWNANDTRLVNPEVRVATDVGSAEGLIQVLSENPNVLLYLTELSRLIGQARRKGTQTIIPVLIEAFDTPPVLTNLTKANPIEARYPFLSIVSGTQPSTLAGLMTDEDIHSGFANRWFYVCGNARGPLPSPPDLDQRAAEQLWRELWNTVRSYDAGTMLRLDARAQERWRAWYEDDYRREPGTEEEDAMRVRHAVLIQKLALIHAVTDGARAVGLQHLEPAIAAVDWMWRHVARLMPTWGGRIDTLIEERMVAVLSRRGPMRRRDLQIQCSNRRWSGTDFARVFDAAVKNGRIVVDPFGTVALAEDA